MDLSMRVTVLSSARRHNLRRRMREFQTINELFTVIEFLIIRLGLLVIAALGIIQLVRHHLRK